MNENPNLGILGTREESVICQSADATVAYGEIPAIDLLGTILAGVLSLKIPMLHRKQKVLVERQECKDDRSFSRTGSMLPGKI